MSDNRQAFLDMIAACEGTATDEGYRALFGYTPNNHKVFDNGYITHPNVKTPFKQTDGMINFSTAAGRYQIIWATFVRLSNKLGTVDFTPETQDRMAVELISEDGALGDVESGNLQAAIDKCSGTWASLPASHYPQPRRDYVFAENAYVQSGGVVA
jgi:muramidase (phage lysozyme)